MGSSAEFADKTKQREPDARPIESTLSCLLPGVAPVRVPRGQRYLVIGRSSSCDVVVDDDSVSRRHARIWTVDLTVEDLGSANGTTVRGARIPPFTRVPVGGAVFALGGVGFAMHAGAEGDAGAERAPTVAPAGPIVADPVMKDLYAKLATFAPSLLSVIVLGETGVGKEVYAQAIHQRSDRADKPFLTLNCAALPESILEAELFGYERGAFTGATQAKAGLFEGADGGTVFLDEIGEMSLVVQAKLLRVIESGEVLRLGALKPKRVDVRFVSATNRDLRQWAADGRFRSDLFFRLNGLAVTLPPLRARKDDILPLARHFLALRGRGGRALALTPRGEAALLAHDWPGNLRELRNVLERAQVMCSVDAIDVEHLELPGPGAAVPPRALADARPTVAPPPPVAPATSATSATVPSEALRDELKGLERERILSALARAAGNQSEAARLLGMSRYTLISRLEEYGVPRPRKGRADR